MTDRQKRNKARNLENLSQVKSLKKKRKKTALHSQGQANLYQRREAHQER